ncbi:hypothetical protein KO506_06530 [Polaribacter vadi]|uniref:hypothetical protein n=1 Tax=Polaribacter TaxID=52959 RepID=UPI001C09B325|nr:MULTISPECIES: hypothetical protein [Polaribacter]MBU3011051.1 hypothetical protein [Polaribacter vadi]MDO6740865.1 hypothetical protein [Polaribacter sp. 1_MG-2023]
MKIMNMNSVRVAAIVLTLSNFMLVSCDTPKKNNMDEAKEEIAELVDMDKDNLDVEMESDLAEDEVKTRTYKMKEKETPIVYDLDARGISGFNDWADYTVVNYELTNLRKVDYVTTRERIQNMNYRIANLGNTIPAWLKTEEVMEDVQDIQDEYLELIEDQDASEKEMQENLEELSEKFDDLKEELDETVNEYIKIHEEAIEEFNEEIKKGKFDAAIEEYNEEIKKLDKIVKEDQ